MPDNAQLDIFQFALLVSDYDEAIQYYTKVLGFDLLEDTDLGSGKRWVRVAPRDLIALCYWQKLKPRFRPDTSEIRLADGFSCLCVPTIFSTSIGATGKRTYASWKNLAMKPSDRSSCSKIYMETCGT